MSQRRMFSPEIVESDAFLDMPISSQALYFHLGMFADDDGFVNPRKIMRMIGVTEDDLKILAAKRFILPFESGVVVVKHWKVNNLVRKDWYRPTQYIDEATMLFVKENGSYTFDKGQGKPLLSLRSRLVNESSTQVRLGKVSIEEREAIPFEIFWNLYDKKIGLPKSKAKWEKLSLKDQQAIIDYIPKYKLAQPDKKFRKNPETFFNNRSWEDELIEDGSVPPLPKKDPETEKRIQATIAKHSVLSTPFESGEEKTSGPGKDVVLEGIGALRSKMRVNK